MDAKSLLFRALLKRTLKRTAMAAVLAWGCFAWATGRISPGAGLAHVYTTVTDKLGRKSKPVAGPSDAQDAAARAAAQVKVAGIELGGKAAAAGIQAKNGYSANDVLCLAHAIYYEARGEPHDTQVGVAQVALNRVATMPGQKSICRIVYLGLGRPMGCLFAQTCRNLGTIPDDETRWRAAIDLAQDVTGGQASLPIYAQATHFNSSSLRPSWVSSVYKLHRAGRFTFYSTQPVGADLAAPTGAVTQRAAVPGAQKAAAAVSTDENAALAARRKAANLPRAMTAAKSAPAARPERAEKTERADPPPRGRTEPSRSPFGDTFN